MKKGRPLQSISAWRSLDALAALDERFPDVMGLITTLGQNVDPVHIDAALEKAVNSLKARSGRSTVQLAANATLEERQLHAAAEVERLAQDRNALAMLHTAVNAELGSTSAELELAETQLRRVLLERAPIPKYEIMLVAKLLRAAGLTERIARDFNAKHVQLLIDALDGGGYSDVATRSRKPRQHAEVALKWTGDNSWGEVVQNSEYFKFDARQLSNFAGADAAQYRSCGLPPFGELADFGYPMLMGSFEAAIDPSAKERACWNICRAWLSDHVTDTLKIDEFRRKAWTLLFGIQHDFAHEIKSLSRVNIPSPFKKGEFLVVQLRNERDARQP